MAEIAGHRSGVLQLLQHGLTISQRARSAPCYVSAIEHQRGDYNGQVLSIRGEDLRSLAILYDRSPNELLAQFIDWEVLAPGTRPTTN